MTHVAPDNTLLPIRQPHRWFLFGFITLCLMTVWIAIPHLSSGATYVAAESTDSSPQTIPPSFDTAPTWVEESLVSVSITWEASLTAYDKTGLQELKAEIEGSCTGFFVEDGTEESASIATAAHCVDQTDEIVNDLKMKLRRQARSNPMALQMISSPGLPITRAVRVSQPLSIEGAVLDDTPLIAQVIGSRPDDDVALLRLNLFSDEVPTLQFAYGAPTIGEKVWACGFAATVVTNSDAARASSSCKDGTVSSRQSRAITGAAITEVSIPMTWGMSGGPTVDEDGNVIGVISHGVDQQPFNFVTDTEGGQLALSALADE